MVSLQVMDLMRELLFTEATAEDAALITSFEEEEEEEKEEEGDCI